MTEAAPAASPPRRLRRAVTWLATAVVLLLLLLVGGGGWYYSDQLLQVPTFPRVAEVEVLRATGTGAGAGTSDTPADAKGAGPDGTVTLPADERYDAGGTWGLWWNGGYAQIDSPRPTEVEGITDQATRWNVRLLEGRIPTSTDVLIERTAYPDDPRDGLGLDYAEVSFDGPLGSYAAWDIPARTSAGNATWAILVHGRGATRRQTLRMVGVLAGHDLHQLAITYRNAPGAPATEDGHGTLGDSEAEDLAAAVEYAREQGAKRIVLVGFSQGGSIALSYLERWTDTDDVIGTILDSPLVSMRATLDLQARNRGIPGPTLGPLLLGTRLISTLRAGIDFGNLEHQDHTDRIGAPVLLFHGTDDTTIPVQSGRDYAARLPDLVTFVEVAGADHVEAWNLDPATYADHVATFLGDLDVAPAGARASGTANASPTTAHTAEPGGSVPEATRVAFEERARRNGGTLVAITRDQDRTVALVAFVDAAGTRFELVSDSPELDRSAVFGGAGELFESGDRCQFLGRTGVTPGAAAIIATDATWSGLVTAEGAAPRAVVLTPTLLGPREVGVWLGVITEPRTLTVLDAQSRPVNC